MMYKEPFEKQNSLFKDTFKGLIVDLPTGEKKDLAKKITQLVEKYNGLGIVKEYNVQTLNDIFEDLS